MDTMPLDVAAFCTAIANVADPAKVGAKLKGTVNVRLLPLSATEAP
jgi:hypothetical protein